MYTRKLHIIDRYHVIANSSTLIDRKTDRQTDINTNISETLPLIYVQHTNSNNCNITVIIAMTQTKIGNHTYHNNQNQTDKKQTNKQTHKHTNTQNRQTHKNRQL